MKHIIMISTSKMEHQGLQDPVEYQDALSKVLKIPWPCHLHDGISYAGKRPSLYRRLSIRLW